jgi:predicted acyl esterase
VDQQMKSEIRDGMQIDWDVPIVMDDGLVLRADVFRPLGEGKYPVLLSYGCYGKGLHFEDGYPSAWQILIEQRPEVLQGSSGKYQNWETVDPEKWVPNGYVCVRVDSRGAGRSPGVINCNSEREDRDLYGCIEWAGIQPWSNERVGLAGISYYSVNQWRVAAMQPPHLKAILTWEGYSDPYREVRRHGGIVCSWAKTWLEIQVKPIQYGRGTRGPKSRVTGELVCGPETLNEAELAKNRLDIYPHVLEHAFDDDYYRHRRADLSKIKVPLLSCGNWGGQGCHLRGNIEGFLGAASKQKWLELHGAPHWVEFYSDYGVAIQRRFYDRFLKGDDNGWDRTPQVMLNVRYPDKLVPRAENEWPLARTQWTQFFLDPSTMELVPEAPQQNGQLTYDALGPGLTFQSAPMQAETEVTGPSALKLWLSSETRDADVFAVLHVFDPNGNELHFYGAFDPKTSVSKGWLRASHRKLDAGKSTPWRPYHSHNEKWPLSPAETVELDIEIWPTSVVVPKGWRLGLTVLGRDYDHGLDVAGLSNIKSPMRGSGPFLHADEQDRPAEIFGKTYTLHFGPDKPAHLLLPIIPEKDGASPEQLACAATEHIS